jgi:hypothetical protein
LASKPLVQFPGYFEQAAVLQDFCSILMAEFGVSGAGAADPVERLLALPPEDAHAALAKVVAVYGASLARCTPCCWNYRVPLEGLLPALQSVCVSLCELRDSFLVSSFWGDRKRQARFAAWHFVCWGGHL